MSINTEPLWRYIHDVVNERVPPEHRAAVTDLVAKTTVHILTTPEFLYGLRIVQDLQYENAQLRQALIALQAAHASRDRKPRTTPRKAAAKKAPAKKAAPRKTATAKNTRAFKQGRAGR